MVNLTFGEQVKIILGRKGMTIKELAEQMEAYTGKSMSRQNMTQRLHRDNFQEQDMRLIAKILGCQFQLSIMEAAEEVAESEVVVEEIHEPEVVEEAAEESREITIEELVDVEETAAVEEEEPEKEVPNFAAVKERDEERNLLRKGVSGFFKKSAPAETVKEVNESEEPVILGDVNPYTGKEYQSNSVRMHPKRIGYVQVYDQEQHKWTDMTEWAFLGYQERKKMLLGKDYVPPIYLD